MATVVKADYGNINELMMDAVSDRKFVGTGNLEVLKDYYKNVDKVFEPLHKSGL